MNFLAGHKLKRILKSNLFWNSLNTSRRLKTEKEREPGQKKTKSKKAK